MIKNYFFQCMIQIVEKRGENSFEFLPLFTFVISLSVIKLQNLMI